MTSEPPAVRAERTGRQVERVLNEMDDRRRDGLDEDPGVPDPHADRTRQFTHVNLSRMRTTWRNEDRIPVEEAHRLADQQINAAFGPAFRLLDELFLKVRIPLTDEQGQVRTDRNGRPLWECDEDGTPREDWTVLSDRDRSHFLHVITTHIVGWQQDAVKLWGDAMYAKGLWEQTFAEGYSAPQGRLTIDDRTQWGHRAAEQERYFAIFKAVLSRRADAVIYSMKQIAGLLEKTQL